MRYLGREFSAHELELIRSLIAQDPSWHRLALSRLVCERLDWRRADAQLKDMNFRVALLLLRMQRDGLIRLPPPQRGSGNGQLRGRRTPPVEPQLPIVASVQPDLELRPPASRAETQLMA